MSIQSIATGRARPWLLPAGWLLVTAVVANQPSLGLDAFWTRQIVLVCLSALLVSGLNLSLGWAGELNMGLPAMYAVGAYLTAYLSSKVFNDLAVCLVLSAVAAIVVGLLAGVPGLRLGGWMLAVCTFLLVGLIPVTLQVIPTSILGGQSGFVGIPRPRLFGHPLREEAFYAVVVVVTALWFALYRNAVKSPFGDSLLVLQHGPVLAPSLGLSRYRLKLTTYALASVPIGVAGSLFAYNDRFVAPESLGLHLILLTLVALIIAGRRSIYAIFVGVVVVQYLNNLSTEFDEWSDVAFGAFLVIGGLAFGGGIAGLARRVARRFIPVATAHAGAGAGAVPDLSGADLRLDAVRKTFGGVHAVADVSLLARAGQITALIGPNGSGKTTTLNLISGLQRPTAGRILLGDRDLTRLPAIQVARCGVARTFQTPAIPIELTVLDAVAAGRIQRRPISLLSTMLRSPKYRRVVRENREAAAQWLAVVGLSPVAGEPAAAMALGTRRMIELARALCADPSLLLLDEVASGLDRDEVEELATVLRKVRDAGATVILVEHNFSLVRSLADHVVVLAEGAVLTDGDPRTIAEHPEVLERFLGTGAGVSGTTLQEGRRA
ncbi:branched-chain amino acid ABC transporter ATP-binding protein/permease [Phytohabitans suffuscus]|uniref:Branched-chain amino acid ABC transporter permease n=1 Tax=Phytohabitans suffuscus TaxID=624315 RepID=A0A6F8YCJ9_9ACTN|nr:branched-chain amino acid ABC transporter ATP-binding protein/permease [Phytohabitans suffuscus]BCB83749.1 branched-chain amino acid ABC transporter permease [Phytohabitans suffuscus]